MTDDDDLTQRFHDAVAGIEPQDRLVQLVNGTAAGRKRRPVRIVAAAAAALIVGVTAVVVSSSSRDRQRVQTSARPPVGPVSKKVAAQRRAEELLDLVPLGPGWVQSSTPPTPMLAHAPQAPAPRGLASAARYWSVVGSWNEVHAWIVAHPPVGLGSGTSSDLGGPSGTTLRTVSYRDRASTGTLLISTAPAGNGRVGIRADAQVIWQPVPAVRFGQRPVAVISGSMALVGGPAPASPRPAAGSVTAVDLGGRVVATVTTDDTGRFTIQVPAGTYHLVGRSPKYGNGQGRCSPEGDAVVGAQDSSVLILCHMK